MSARSALLVTFRQPPRATLLRALAIASLLTACDEADRMVAPSTSPQFTVGEGVTPTFIGQGTFDQGFEVKRKTGDWHVQVKAKGGLEVLVRSFSYTPGAQSGWHQHPGPVFIQVLEGTVTFFEADDPNCEPIVVNAGEGYLDAGHGHIGRNLSGAPARDLVVFLAPPGTQVADLRIDIDAPGNCPF